MIAIDKLLVFLLFFIVLAIGLGILIGWVHPTGEHISVENDLRNCCPLYVANGCPDAEAVLDTIQCSAGADNTLFRVMERAGIRNVEQLQSFCGCPRR